MYTDNIRQFMGRRLSRDRYEMEAAVISDDTPQCNINCALLRQTRNIAERHLR